MRKNMGAVDRVVRAVLGAVLGALVLKGTVAGALAVVLGLVAVVFIGTAAIGFCPAYVPFGISTRGKGGGCCCG